MEAFQKEVRKLNQLVNENEQGMSTWWGILDERMSNLFEMYYGVDTELLNMSELRKQTEAKRTKVS